YYNASQSGHGFSVEFGEFGPGMPMAVIFWYTFEDNGQSISMGGQGVPVGNRVEINLESPSGMKYGEFDPLTVVRNPGGIAVFEFSDRNNATFSYTPSDYSAVQWGHTTSIVDLPLTKIFGMPANKYFTPAD
ncbi:MAG TPA: hypothetical protein VJ965_00005, partial [Anaerolineales bacterium]|nr:hypothetical protein [Anaerolineales bacterium]